MSKKIEILKKAVFITCDNKYIPLAIIALKCFKNKNKNYDMFIIGTNCHDLNRKICEEHDIKNINIDLEKDFPFLEKRKYGKNYPIECFYHFYSYKVLDTYDYILQIEPDFYTNKKIDIDLKLIEYIGCSVNKKIKIYDFKVILNDLDKIKKVYKNYDINQYRALPGFKIYNVKNLKKINFYEKIVEYYKISYRINAQRCGDDSLFVLYHMLNKNHVYFLDEMYNIINYNFNTDKVLDVYHYHFAGKTKKYWKKGVRDDVNRYFKNKMYEFIYNNFSMSFIKENIPSIYKNISNIKINFYYYAHNNNFGDLITPYFLNKFCDKKDYDYVLNEKKIFTKTKKIIGCGSIMRLCNKNTIVYGSGIRDRKQKINRGIIKIVRGPLTRKRLLEIKCYCPPVYGDPGLILPLYYQPNIKKKYKIGIIPHHIHYDNVVEKYKNLENTLIINLINPNIEETIDSILSCEKTISSSLHGLIVSDAYGVPNKWVQFDNKINGDNTKYYDYFESVNRLDKEFINCLDNLKIPDNVYDIIENVNISYDIDELKNNMFFDKKGIKQYTKYLIKSLH